MGVVKEKRANRLHRIKNFDDKYGGLTAADQLLLSRPISELRDLVAKDEASRLEVWTAYTKKAIECHSQTNCLTELIDFEGEEHDSGPLAGVPVSIKDNFGIAGYDASMGFPARCNKPVALDNPLIKLLKDAGAVLFTKTNIPTGMLSVLSSNAVWGTTTNPHGENRSPGGSSSGEGALIAGGGSRVGIGTDIGGSVRIPAHMCGIYSLRMSHNRFPRCWLDDASTPGFEGIPDVSSPLAKTVSDLRFFIEGVMSMKPWEYCYQLLPIPWRTKASTAGDSDSVPKKVGYIRDDGFLKVTPAVERALETVIAALRAKGIEVEEFKLPRNGETYGEAYASLVLADGFETVSRPLGIFEKSDPVVDSVRTYARIPRWLRNIIEWVIGTVFRQRALAAELKDIGPHTTAKYFESVVHRENLRREFWDAWKASGIDILITPPMPTPALPALHFLPDSICNYTSLFNLLDYPAGVIPVTTVDSEKDEIPSSVDTSKFNWATKSYFDNYDARSMHGLPVGVQVVGKRLDDEHVLDVMEYIDSLINK